MANVKTNPNEWNELVFLSTVEDLSEEQTEQLKALREIFFPKKKDNYITEFREVEVIDNEGTKYIYRNVFECSEELGIRIPNINRAHNKNRPMAKGKFEGYRFKIRPLKTKYLDYLEDDE